MIVRDVHIQTKIRVFSVKIAIFENQIAKNEIHHDSERSA